MWIRVLLLYKILMFLYQIAYCHIPSHLPTPSSKVDMYCELADTCVHDTVPICGKMGDEKRTFLDLCDLLEYACDTSNIFAHVEDMEGCPVYKKKN